MQSSEWSYTLLTYLLKMRIPIPVTMNMLIVVGIGAVLTFVLSALPRPFKILSGITAIATIAVAVIIGIDDYRGGDLFDRAVGSECAGWNDYVDMFDDLTLEYDEIMGKWNGAYLSSSEVAALARDTRSLVDRLNSANPPEAANDIHYNFLSILEEIERQLWNYSNGADFSVTRINSMLDRHDSFVEGANEICG